MASEKAFAQRQGKALLLYLVLLLAHFHAPDWQASGDFEPGQYEFIRETIDNACDDGLTGKAFTMNVSATLNNRYDRFWNVAMGQTETPATKDAVLYGYAYKQHWFWINNYRNGKFVIVWKDYNCGEQFSGEWGDLGQVLAYNNNQTTPNLGLLNLVLPASMDDNGVEDIWRLAFSTVNLIDGHHANTLSAVFATGYLVEFAITACLRVQGSYICQTSSNRFDCYVCLLNYVDSSFVVSMSIDSLFERPKVVCQNASCNSHPPPNSHGLAASQQAQASGAPSQPMMPRQPAQSHPTYIPLGQPQSGPPIQGGNQPRSQAPNHRPEPVGAPVAQPRPLNNQGAPAQPLSEEERKRKAKQDLDRALKDLAQHTEQLKGQLGRMNEELKRNPQMRRRLGREEPSSQSCWVKLMLCLPPGAMLRISVPISVYIFILQLPFLICDLAIPLTADESECMDQSSILRLRVWMLVFGIIEALLFVGWLVYCIVVCCGVDVNIITALKVQQKFTIACLVKAVVCAVTETVLLFAVMTPHCGGGTYAYGIILFVIHILMGLVACCYVCCAGETAEERRIRRGL